MHIDNWLFFLLVAVAGLFRWLMSTANKASKETGNPEEKSTPAPRAPVDSDEQRIRKFLEALGQPPGSRPPPPVAPRQMDTERAAREARVRLEQTKRAAAEPKRKILVPTANLPPLTTVPPPLPAVEYPVAADQTEEVRLSARSTTGLSTMFEVQESGVGAQVSTTPASNINIITLLRSPSGLRDAIILREIFGPPRSMQPLELV